MPPLHPLFHRENLVFDEDGLPRYEKLASFIEDAITAGRLLPGQRLPTVRQLSAGLGVSATTIVSAFEILAQRNLISPEVGRGTFVSRVTRATAPHSEEQRSSSQLSDRDHRAPWRRRALASMGARLRASYPNAMDCSTGRPDPALLPVAAVRRAWARVAKKIDARDLQYAGPEPIESFATLLLPLLEADLVPARTEDLIVGSSAQQLMTLALEIVIGPGGGTNPLVAVEEPGYPTILDTFERAGATLVGVSVDELGAIPASLDAALGRGAKAVLLTPRAHNPTGASWSRERRSDLANVLAAHRDVIAIEDDQFAGIADTQPGSLLSDSRLDSRVMYIRSFSKSIGPDLRLAVAASGPRLHEALAEAKSFADGWTSRLLQRVLAGVLADEELHSLLNNARRAYSQRRKSAADAFNRALSTHGAGVRCGRDGLNLWVQLPRGVDAKEVVERSAAAGVKLAEGEAFFLRPGHGDVVRLNAGSVTKEDAARAGRELAESALRCSWGKLGSIHV